MMTMGRLIEMIAHSAEEIRHWDDMQKGKFADGRHHDLVLRGEGKGIRRIAWKRVDPGLEEGERLLARQGPGNDCVGSNRDFEGFVARLADGLQRVGERRRTQGPEPGFGF